MSAVWIRRIVDLFIGIFVIGAVIKVIRNIAAAISGDFGRLRWPVQAGDVGVDVPMGSDSLIRFSSGELITENQMFGHAFDLGIQLATIALFLAACFALRRVLVHFSSGEMLTENNVAGLRKIGLALLGVCALSLVQVLVLQPIMLAAVEVPAGVALHPSISWDVAGKDNIWLDYNVPLFTFMLGGVALLFSAAFRNGLDYRKDSESLI